MLRFKLLALCLILVSIDTIVSFATLADAIPSPPTNLTLVDLGSNSIQATWTTGAGASSTMLRVKRGNSPSTITEGELFYLGSAENASSTGFDLDSITYCISAWSRAADNITYSSTYDTAEIGGEGMTTVAVVGVVLSITALALVASLGREKHQPLSSILWGADIIAWLFFIGYMTNILWPSGNTYLVTGIGILGVAMTIVAVTQVISPYFGTRQSRWSRYEEQKKLDRQRIIDATSRWRH